ncbi:MAG: methyltransferase [Bacteroidetes bacterium]|nr:methyltransferase [Bacteroidota bacterium]
MLLQHRLHRPHAQRRVNYQAPKNQLLNQTKSHIFAQNYCHCMKTLLCLFTAFPFVLSAQSDTSGQRNMIMGLVNYRNELIIRNPVGFKQIYQLDELWKAENGEQASDFVFNVTYAYHILNYSPEKIIKLYQKKVPDFKPTQLLTPEMIQIVAENDDWMSLLNNRILKPSPPFQIENQTTLFEELAFYKIQNGMQVAEIGAGDGSFSLLLGLAFDSLQIYINDLDKDAVQYAASKIDRCKSVKESNQYFTVEGKKKSTALESVHLDKVIIRNSFHHFSHQSEMLASIRQSLLPDGELFITDPVIKEDEIPDCKNAMKLELVRKSIKENGFEILEEKPVKDWNWVMFHCIPTEDK